MAQVEDKSQDGKLTSNHIINDVKCKWSKYCNEKEEDYQVVKQKQCQPNAAYKKYSLNMKIQTGLNGWEMIKHI